MENTHDRYFQVTGRRYAPRIPLPLLAFRDNHENALPVQPGKIVKAWHLPEDERFVLIEVDGQEFHAFASDLFECCDVLPDLPDRRVRLLLTSAAA